MVRKGRVGWSELEQDETGKDRKDGLRPGTGQICVGGLRWRWVEWDWMGGGVVRRQLGRV